MTDYLYCKVYVRFEGVRRELVDIVAQIVLGTAKRSTVQASWGEIDIEDNEDCDEVRADEACGDGDGFLFWPFYLDVTARTDILPASHVGEVSDLLEGLWEQGLSAVAACDFEDDLPYGGGILRPQEGAV